MKKIFLILSTVLAMVTAVSCQDSDETEIIATTGVTLNTSAVSIFPGEQVELKATLTPENGTSSYKTWASSDAKIATVDVWGRVLGVNPGEATITVTTASGKHTATCKVTVKEIPATGVTLNKTETSVYIGENETLTVTVTPGNTSDKTITWTSSKPEIATVGEDGKVTGVELGTATITATTKNGISASCEVTVKLRTPTEPEQVTLWKADNAGYRGLFGAASDNGKTAGIGNWLSYNDGVAYWTENTTGAPRKATLTLSTGSTITVNQVEAKDLAGNYTFYNYSFKSSGVSNTVVASGTRRHETAVEFKVVENPKNLNGHVHNLDIVGLYLDFTVPASLEIVNDAPVIYTYMSLDYQKVSNGTEVACIPELTNSTTYGTGYFAPLKFGVEDCNYTWLEWGLDDFFGAPKFTVGTPAQRLVSSGMYCCGFSFVTKGYKEGTYTTIYQFNYSNSWTYTGDSGAYFAKK